MVNSILTLIFIFFLLPFGFFPQENELNTKKKELSSLKSEISSLEKVIQSKIQKEKETYIILQNYDKQSFLLNKIINQYRNEQKLKEEQIANTEKNIKFLEEEINKLQLNYSKYVNAVYRKRISSNLAVLFDSESISQAVRRIFYLKKFSERREKDLIKFENKKNELTAAKQQLEIDKSEMDLLIKEKSAEEKLLSSKILERKKLIAALRNDKNELKKELDAKKKSEISIRNIIAKLSEEKLKRDQEEKEKLKKMNDKLSSTVKKDKELTNRQLNIKSQASKSNEIAANNFPSFEKSKGKLNWPVTNGKIVKRYGEQLNQKLKTVTLNYGVDIKVTSDLTVRSVSNGVISAIEWIPGYGSVIIISHSDEYRTVYSHLNSIFVHEGDIVQAGQVIATVGEGIDGYILHFEIWNSRENQNPEIWLAKK